MGEPQSRQGQKSKEHPGSALHGEKSLELTGSRDEKPLEAPCFQVNGGISLVGFKAIHLFRISAIVFKQVPM